MKSTKLKLIELRQENCGYNPEKNDTIKTKRNFMKSTKLKLIELRQENWGYNPEKAEDIGTITDLVHELIITTEDNHNFYFTKTNCSNEIDFIQSYPKQYGVIFNNNFYIQD